MFRIQWLLFLSILLHGAEIPWQTADLKKTPQHWGASTAEGGVKAVWLAGPSYKAKPTRAFAYYGIPEGGTRAPGMVLIHGGGGTAFAEWVRMWNREGFAVIAVDTVGTWPDKADTNP
jgi:hypothetical protein